MDIILVSETSCHYLAILTVKLTFIMAIPVGGLGATCNKIITTVSTEHAYVHGYITLCIHVCIRIVNYAHTYIHTYICAYVRTYIHTDLHTYRCLYIHCTYIHNK